MLVTSLFSLLLLPLATSSPISPYSLQVRAKDPGDPAGSAKVLADLKSIVADIKTLNATVTSFKPNSITGLQTAQKIMAETTVIENALKGAISDTTASMPFNDNQSVKVGINTLGLEPLIKSLLQNIIAHKAAFASIDFVLDLSKSVEKSLIAQRKLTEQFGAALKKKLTKQFAKMEPATTKMIVSFFDAAIKAFSSCSGIVCVPGGIGG